MEPLHYTQLSGNWATLLLPIRSDESIDYEILQETLETLVSANLNGLYSNGTAGEFYTQTEDEFDRIQLMLAEKCNGAGIRFQIGCSHTSAQVTLERIRRITSLRPSAIQVILPDWCAPSLEESANFLYRVAEVAEPIGIVLYNPPHAKVVLTPDDYRQLRDRGIRLLGCKVSGGNPTWYAAMRDADPQLSIFVPGHRLATGIACGARGSYSNIACLNPRVSQQWYELMLRDLPAALEFEKKVVTFITDTIMPYITKMKYCSAAIDKFLAEVGGWSRTGTRVRWPSKSVPAEEVIRVRKIARRQLPEFFETTLHRS